MPKVIYIVNETLFFVLILKTKSYLTNKYRLIDWNSSGNVAERVCMNTPTTIKLIQYMKSHSSVFWPIYADIVLQTVNAILLFSSPKAVDKRIACCRMIFSVYVTVMFATVQ